MRVHSLVALSQNRQKLAIGLSVVLIAVLAILVLLKRAASADPVALVLVSRGADEHSAQFTAYATNTSKHQISLGPTAYVQYEDQSGKLLIDAGSLWEGRIDSLQPAKVTEARFGIPADYRRVRVFVRGLSEVGPLPQLASRCVRPLAPREIPQKGTWKYLYDWGLVTGLRPVSCSSGWALNPQATRTRGNPE
jgi:hypothetical protein